MAKTKRGRPKSGKVTKDRQIMMRTTDATADALEQVAREMDRSVSWILNDLAVKFIASRRPKANAANAKADPSEAF
jgi:predicted transcriptional regulator